MLRKVLCVDDEENLLQGLQRQLRNRFDLETCNDPQAALELIQKQGPYAVVVSDMRMPGLDGVQFLAQVRALAPETVRLMLTGNADQQTAADAVNQGEIFRFLCKPCPTDLLATAIEAGLEQYRLVTSERELLSDTLSGSVTMLTEILATINPTAFGRAQTIRKMVRQICQALAQQNAWEVELAAMLFQVGCITVPHGILEKQARGGRLSAEESCIFRGHPEIGGRLIGRIPRLGGVGKIVALQLHTPDEMSTLEIAPQLQRSVGILQAAVKFDHLLSEGFTLEKVLASVQHELFLNDPELLRALAALPTPNYVVRSVTVNELDDGMIFDEHVAAGSGIILVSYGSAVVPWIRDRLKAYATTVEGVRQPIRVRIASYTS